MKTLTIATLTLISLLALEACKQASKPVELSTQTDKEAVVTSPMEGIVEYTDALRGQSIMTDGHYVFLYGPTDESAPMIGEAGVYQISDDTMWTIESTSGDTIAYTVMDEAREVTDRGRAFKRH
jgi:hypothetical protein